MLLSYEKQLDAKTALLLRAAISKREKFSHFKDYAMLCKAYAKFLNKTKREAYGDRFPPALPLGKYNFPKNNLVNGGATIDFMQ